MSRLESRKGLRPPVRESGLQGGVLTLSRHRKGPTLSQAAAVGGSRGLYGVSVILCYTVLYCVILYYTVVYCVLCYTVLYCAKLYYNEIMTLSVSNNWIFG